MRYVAGIAVKIYLTSKGISQAFVSKKTGIPRNVLNDRLNGKSELQAGELFLIADALEIPLDTIRLLSSAIANTLDHKEIISQLSPRGQEGIIKLGDLSNLPVNKTPALKSAGHHS